MNEMVKETCSDFFLFPSYLIFVLLKELNISDGPEIAHPNSVLFKGGHKIFVQVYDTDMEQI